MSRHIAPALSVADSALEVWAKWVHAGLEGIGWPPRTLLAKVIEEGFTGAAHGSVVPEMPDAVLATERAILRLRSIDRKVVVKHYCNWEPIETSARYCHMTPGRFRTLLHRARREVAAYLDGAFVATKRAV